MTNDEVMKVLSNYEQLFKINNLLHDVLRSLGWTLIELLHFFVKGIETIFNQVYSYLDFFDSDEFNKFIKIDNAVYIVFIAFGFVILGYKVIFKKQKSNILNNLLLSFVILVGLGTAMATLKNIAVATVGTSSINMISDETINSNVYDLKYLIPRDFQNYKTDNNKLGSNILTIDINENLVGGEDGDKDLLEQRVVINENGEKELEKLSVGFGVIFPQYYYRYNINFITVIITFVVIAVVFVLSIVKIGRIIFELGVNRILLTFLSLFEIASMQKAKKVLSEIINSFIILIIINILIRLYVVFTTWASMNITNPILYILVLIGVSFGVIDAPNIIQKIFGIDAGLQSGFKTLASVYHGGKIAGNIGNAIKNTAGGIVNAGAGIVGAGTGVMNSLSNKNKDDKETKDKNEGIHSKNNNDKKKTENLESEGIHQNDSNQKQENNDVSKFESEGIHQDDSNQDIREEETQDNINGAFEGGGIYSEGDEQEDKEDIAQDNTKELFKGEGIHSEGNKQENKKNIAQNNTKGSFKDEGIHSQDNEQKNQNKQLNDNSEVLKNENMNSENAKSNQYEEEMGKFMNDIRDEGVYSGSEKNSANSNDFRGENGYFDYLSESKDTTNTFNNKSTINDNSESINEKTNNNQIPRNKTNNNQIPRNKTNNNQIPRNKTNNNQIPRSKTNNNQYEEEMGKFMNDIKDEIVKETYISAFKDKVQNSKPAKSYKKHNDLAKNTVDYIKNKKRR